MKNLLINLLKKYFLKQHIFKPSSLIKRKTGGIIYEVEACLYDEHLDPILIIREYGKSKLFSVRYLEMLEFEEYRKMPAGDVDIF